MFQCCSFCTTRDVFIDTGISVTDENVVRSENAPAQSDSVDVVAQASTQFQLEARVTLERNKVSHNYLICLLKFKSLLALLKCFNLNTRLVESLVKSKLTSFYK